MARSSDRPGVDDHRVIALVQEDAVEDVEGVDHADALDEGRLAMPVEGLGREPAGIDLAALGHELLQLVVEVQVPREGLIAETREAALDAEGDAGAVEQDGGVEALALQAGRLEEVHEADLALEGDGVEGDERLLARLGLHVLEDLLLVVD